MNKNVFLNFRQLKFSETYSEKRLILVQKVLGVQLAKKLVGFVLYLLGAPRKSISELIDMPYDTFKSFTDRLEGNGISAFFDNRLHSDSESAERIQEIKTEVSIVENYIIIALDSEKQIRIPRTNSLQVKVVLLTLLKNNVLPLNEVATVLGCTKSHILKLMDKLFSMGTEALSDHRRGQQTDYVFTSEVKSEIILQAAGNAIVGKSTSSTSIASDLLHRKNLELSDRSIRLHLCRLGLKGIKEKLPELVKHLKKNLM